MSRITVFAFIVSMTSCLSPNNDSESIRLKLLEYQHAVEKLDTAGTCQLFADNSVIIESGSIEGDYKTYASHHLAPELKEFKSFKFTDYNCSVLVNHEMAYATEKFKFCIVLAKDSTVINRKGVSSIVLKKINSDWKIVSYHMSSRK